MKTLLLALAVVALVCLGSADQLGLGRQRIDWGQGQAVGPSFTLCSECNRNTPSRCSTDHRCYRGWCYTLYKPDENCELKWAVKGCAEKCPTEGPNERVKCCRSPNCNSDLNDNP
uniref:Three finger toxin n=1 Tax=Boiga nigriceps TaxID=1867089 RepID=A0A193CHL8_9SAUR|nr:three finger toxin [Boiga nigriceps]